MAFVFGNDRGNVHVSSRRLSDASPRKRLVDRASVNAPTTDMGVVRLVILSEQYHFLTRSRTGGAFVQKSSRAVPAVYNLCGRVDIVHAERTIERCGSAHYPRVHT